MANLRKSFDDALNEKDESYGKNPSSSFENRILLKHLKEQIEKLER